MVRRKKEEKEDGDSGARASIEIGFDAFLNYARRKKEKKRKKIPGFFRRDTCA